MDPEVGHEAAASPARRAALSVLGDMRAGRKTARDAIDELVRRHPLSPRDVAFTTELVTGVTRHRLTLARVLSQFVPRGWNRVNQRVQDILLLAAYQIIFLDGVPEFAAVHEAVEQTKREAGPGPSRFVNGVLRNLLRQIERRRIPTEQADPVRAIPVDLQQSCQFRRPVLPDPGAKPIEYLADATSHPGWLVAKWMQSFGKKQVTEICLAGMGRPPIFLRPNLRKITAADLVQRLTAEEVTAELSKRGDQAVVYDGAGLLRSEVFAQGLCQPQDPTAMKVVEVMKLRPGATVLDLCAAPGTKTTQMAEIMNNQGHVLASDRDTERLKLVLENSRRLGFEIIQVVDPQEIPAVAGKLERLDWILIDAPCSNTGVLARRPEARYRVSQKGIESLAEVQFGLLEQAAALARPTTRVLYSTCSIEPEENEEVMKRFGQVHPDWRLINSERTFPYRGADAKDWCDGGFWAIWTPGRSR